MKRYELKEIRYNEGDRLLEATFTPLEGEKVVVKSLRLTNENLEGLIKSKDEFLGQVYMPIMNAVKDSVPWPSWYAYHMCEKEKEECIEKVKRIAEKKREKENEKIKEAKKQIAQSENDVEEITKKVKNEEYVYKKLKKRIERRRKFNLKTLEDERRLYGLEQDILYEMMIKEICETRIIDSTREIERREASLVKQDRKLAEALEEIQKEFRTEKSRIRELPTEANLVLGYIPLKVLSGMKYRKIIGCYIIRNSKNGKVYIGQSKDVMRRVTKEHFQGTKVKNCIFADDYYETPANERASLFEVKIIPCSTKDELDRTEKQLINDYDSFRKGYNRTRGNE